MVSTYVDEHYNYQPYRPMKQRSDDDYEQAYVVHVHSYYAKNKRLPE
jgi:acyl-CoA-binding protein